MNICIIGRHRLKENLSDNHMDAPIFLHFAKQFDEVFLIFESDKSRPSETQHQNLRLYLIPRKSGVLGALYFALKAMLIGLRLSRKYGIDVISASEPFGAGIAGVILKVLLRKKLVFQIQGQLLNLPPESYSRLRRKLSYIVTKGVSLFSDGVRCSSMEIYEAALRSGIPMKKLFHVPYRCDVETFNPERWREKGRKVRQECGFGEEHTVLVFLGALLVDKGVFVLLEAFQQLHQWHPNMGVLFMGDGPCRSGLQSAASQGGVEGCVALTGFVDYKDVPGYLAAGDIFVFPTKHEGMGRALMEAMAMELPVIATGVGGVPELVQHNVTGLLLERGTADEIAVAIEGLLDNPEGAETLGKNARRLIVEQYSFKPNADLFVQAHLNILNSPGPIRR